MSHVPCNADFNWDTFESEWYHDHNYRDLRDDDREIMTRIRDFFARSGVSHGSGIDVGAGANLYPALAMLPFCDRLELDDFSANNVAWLDHAIRRYGTTWDQFWSVYRENPAYAAIADPRARLARATQVRQASVFDLPRTTWDMGTMFFAACSLSNDMDEFRRAVKCFVGALRPTAPFAMAFMEKSKGYAVNGTFFPAVEIDRDNVARALDGIAYNVDIDRVTTNNPLRDGYDGAMIVAVGRACG